MDEQASATQGPWSRVRNRQTVGGRDLGLPGISGAADIAWRLQAYADEVAECLESALADDVDLDNELTSLLAEVATAETVGDCPHDPERQLALDAALAFRFMDEAVQAIYARASVSLQLMLWDRMSDACREAVTRLLLAMLNSDEAARSRAARQAALHRHATSAQARAREFIHECWTQWLDRPNTYASVAEFARDMVSKFPGVINSPVTVERWVRAWRMNAP